MFIDFDFTVRGLTVKFDNLSEVPGGVTPFWYFGDGSSSNDLSPTHSYKGTGVYLVSLIYRDSNNIEVAKGSNYVTVSDQVKTFLPDTIYNIIDTYIPEEIFGKVSRKDKKTFINKWQLYIYPLVNREIPDEEYNNEGYYEALENQLIVELAAYDWMVVDITNLYKSTARRILNANTSKIAGDTPSPEGGIKHITTGPTEVEYFDSGSRDAEFASILNKVIQPGGLIDTLRANICMLASRLDIYLPICRNIFQITKAPKVVNRRRPGPIDGPDPSLPVNK